MEVLSEVLKSVALGLVQGFGEFLPISSSGHLLMLQRLFGLTEGGRLTTVLLHAATLAAVCIVYREQLAALIKKPIQRKTLWLIAATAVTAAITFAFGKLFDAADGGGLLWICFLVTSAILAAGELVKRNFPRRLALGDMKLRHAALIGALQGIAVLPGISRSGATITGALICGFKKKDAAEFSFLLSVPAILGGTVLELPELFRSGAGDLSWYAILIGMAAAGISGWFSVRFMIRLITKRSLWGFSAYTALLGIFLLLDRYLFKLF